MMTVCLVLAAFGAGCAIGEWDTLKTWGGWRPFKPDRHPHYNKFQIMRDWK